MGGPALGTGDAALCQGPVLRIVELMSTIAHRAFVGALFGFRSQRRNAAILRIDDERTTAVRCHAAAVAPEFVVARFRSVSPPPSRRSASTLFNSCFSNAATSCSVMVACPRIMQAAPAASAWRWSRCPAGRDARRRCGARSTSPLARNQDSPRAARPPPGQPKKQRV